MGLLLVGKGKMIQQLPFGLGATTKVWPSGLTSLAALSLYWLLPALGQLRRYPAGGHALFEREPLLCSVPPVAPAVLLACDSGSSQVRRW